MAALLDGLLTVHRHHRLLVSVVTLPGDPQGTLILPDLPCKCFHIPIN